MDLKALMQKLETINKTEILTESEKKETTWTDKSGKKHPATQVKGDKYTGKEAEKEAKPKKDDLDEQFNSAIAKSLVEEFGYEIDEAEVTSGSGAPVTTAAPQGAPATPGNGPWPAGSPQATAWAALTPEDQKWLGGADPTDQFILARAPNKGKPAAAATGAATKPAADPTNPNSADAVNGMDKASDDAAAGAATKPAAVDPAVAATREKFKALMDKLEKTGGVSGAAAAPAAPAAGAATKPASKPAAGAATKPAAGGATMPAVDAMGNVTGVQENVAYEDDRILLAIKNIQY